jgi:hypothetical protein
MLRLITKYFLSKVLFVAWFLITLSPALLLAWLQHYREEKESWLAGVAALWALACLVGSWWLGETTARYIVEENQMFLDAVKRTLYDLRLRLAFIPIIGLWFTPDEDKTHYDEDDD